jgi:hypothetical protein
VTRNDDDDDNNNNNYRTYDIRHVTEFFNLDVGLPRFSFSQFILCVKMKLRVCSYVRL